MQAATIDHHAADSDGSAAEFASISGEVARSSANDLASIRLTPRESEVLGWIAVGKSDWQIGRILGISAKTANYHVENVKRKFRVSTRLQAIAEAIRQGILT